MDRGADLFLAVIGRDEEAQAGGVLGHGRVQNRLDVNAAIEQGAAPGEGS